MDSVSEKIKPLRTGLGGRHVGEKASVAMRTVRNLKAEDVSFQSTSAVPRVTPIKADTGSASAVRLHTRDDRNTGDQDRTIPLSGLKTLLLDRLSGCKSSGGEKISSSSINSAQADSACRALRAKKLLVTKIVITSVLICAATRGTHQLIAMLFFRLIA